jgi:hypothetical protein
MEPTNKYLEKIASLSVVGKSWVRDVLPKLTKNSVSALTTANSKAKAFAGNNFHKSIHTKQELHAFSNSGLVQNAVKRGLTAPEANRAVKLATGLAAKTVKSQGT